MLYSLLLIACGFLSLVAAQTPIATSQNIAFDLPDVTAKVQQVNGEVQLEAFRSVTNDRILNLNECHLPQRNSQLFWVSIGHPKLVRANDAAVFYRRSDGFHVFVEMLTAQHSEILANATSEKYGIPVTPRQIAHLPLSKFECTVSVYENTERLIIKGNVRTFANYPLRVDFHAPQVTRERKLFEKTMQAEESVDIECTLASTGKQTRLNTLVITSRDMQALGLTEKLFGPSHPIDKTVYVTRQQMNTLAAELYSSLSIVEEYEMPQYQFSEAFVNELVRQTASRVFTLTPFNEAIEGLSKFGIDYSEDLRPDEIKRDFGRIFNFSSFNNRSHIVVDNEELQSMKQGASHSGSLSGKYGTLLLSVEASASFATQSHNDWSRGTKNLDDQLRELNAASKNEIEWALEGRKLVPKSINVSKLSRANFSRTVAFSRIRRQIEEAPFVRKLALYWDNANRTERNAQNFHQLQNEVRELRKEFLASLNFMRQQISVLNSTKLHAQHFQQLQNGIQELRGEFRAPLNLMRQQISVLNSTKLHAQHFQQLQNEIQEFRGEFGVSKNSLQRRIDVLDSTKLSRCMICAWFASGWFSNSPGHWKCWDGDNGTPVYTFTKDHRDDLYGIVCS